MRRKSRKSKPISISDLTSEIYKSEKISRKIDSIEILNSWNQITNKLIQDRTEKVYVSEKRKVFIKVSSAPLRNELENNKKKLLKELQKRHNSIEEIFFT
ncbi:MAG: DciA family protein [Cytophagales bacterium]|nr:MAG: hypothetical protein CNE34_01985 [Rhodothermaeota bacterium MED-G18]|tara:strand:+ start:2319 stop:2618 length:300 start_codon:yes stop_codon:yes gene_type:complete